MPANARTHAGPLYDTNKKLVLLLSSAAAAAAAAAAAVFCYRMVHVESPKFSPHECLSQYLVKENILYHTDPHDQCKGVRGSHGQLS